MIRQRVIVVGGGAAGFFGAITCAEAAPDCEVLLLEKGPQFLQKVKISGGGRCNVTHSCFEPRELTKRYPRGERELISPFHQFQARDTVEWFESRGVKLKAEADGRMFPITDSSQTVIDCLIREASNRGIQLKANCGVEAILKQENRFLVRTSSAGEILADRILLATGGARTPAQAGLAQSLGHAIEEPVPSLFTFHIEAKWVRELAGVSANPVEAMVRGSKLRERGPLLFTHWGLSGPVILRLSAWGARELHRHDYKFTLALNWTPTFNEEQLRAEFQARAKSQGAKSVVNSAVGGLSSRLWEQLVSQAQIGKERRWSALARDEAQRLARVLNNTELHVSGKSLNKDEFVTCGGVKLKEVNFKTMESKNCPGLFFAGELLDIDGITGGFNFQAAWTTGWIAGKSIAESLNR